MKNLLVICPRYPPKENFPRGTFVKAQVDELKRYFNKIVVISTIPYVPKFLYLFVPEKRKQESLMGNYSYDNVEVYYTKDFILPFGFYKKKWGDIIYRKSLKLLEKMHFKPDIIHAHFTWPTGYASVKLGEKLNIPIVITIHEDHDWFLKEYNSKDSKIHWTWKNASMIIRVNEMDAPLLKKINKNVYSIPNGFIPNKLNVVDKNLARKKLGLPKDHKIVFTLGHLLERKGFHYLIESMSFVLKKRKDVLCFIGGDGPSKKKLQNQIEQLNLNAHVKLLGFLPEKELTLWMNAADIFVLPSLSEGNPTVMFEALGVGLPFVGTDVGGVSEIIISEDYGLLCEPKNSEDLYIKILIGIEKKWNRKEIMRYAEQFTWENIAKRIFDVYSEMT